MLYGVDISNHQDLPSTYREQQWYRDAQFVIAQAIPRPRPSGYTGAQLLAAQEDGKAPGIYSWLWHDPSWRMDPDVATDQRIRLATVPEDVTLKMRPWLDEEDNQSTGWANISIQQRKDDVLRALDTLDTFAASRRLPEAGIYWSDYFIDLLFQGDIAFVEGRKQWKAHYSRPAGSLIGGPVVAHQYTSTPIDQNMMLESEIVGGEDVDAQERAAYEERINGLTQTIGLIAGDLLRPLTRPTAGKYVKTFVDQVRAEADKLGIGHV